MVAGLLAAQPREEHSHRAGCNYCNRADPLPCHEADYGRCSPGGFLSSLARAFPAPSAQGRSLFALMGDRDRALRLGSLRVRRHPCAVRRRWVAFGSGSGRRLATALSALPGWATVSISSLISVPTPWTPHRQVCEKLWRAACFGQHERQAYADGAGDVGCRRLGPVCVRHRLACAPAKPAVVG